MFFQTCLGVGGENTPQKKPAKSIGRERTFGDQSTFEGLLQHLQNVCNLVSADLKRKEQKVHATSASPSSTGFRLTPR